MRLSRTPALVLAGWLAIFAGSARGQEVLYGGNGGHNNGSSINDGSLVTLDPVTAAVTLVGHPAGVDRLTGLAFDSAGTLWASTSTRGGFPPPPPVLTSSLIRLDPATGTLAATIGPITDGPGGPAISISDISIQPFTDVLFGVRSPHDGLGGAGTLYTIDRTTAVATLVGRTRTFFATIAFAPDGTLYEAAADLDSGPVFPSIRTLDPSTGAFLTTVSTAKYFGALAVRSDGTLFGSTGDEHEIYTIDPVSGALTLVGDTGLNFVGSLAFRSAPSGPCAPGAHNLCLNNERFSVSARWRTTDGSSGEATAVPLTADSGYFWFFNSANIEVVVKLLNACSIGGHYWVFAAGLTNVEVTLAVTDTETGARKSYLNQLGTAFQPIQDTSAFSTCP